MSKNSDDNSADRYELREEVGLDADLDPALQNLVISSRSAGEDRFLLEKQIAKGSVDVIAQLHDPEEPVDGLTVVQKVGQIVTGTVEIKKIEDVRRHPNVVSLEMTRKLYPTLGRSVYEIRAYREQLREALPAGAELFDGSCVVVGFIDTDCDFVHPNFCVTDNGVRKTRILYLWDQRHKLTPISPPDYPYGKEFNDQMINEALMEQRRDDCYRKLDYNPYREGHGTHVMDIAVGNGRGTCPSGVAPKADIIFVHSDLENSHKLFDAVKYIFEKAAEVNKPAVVNISINGRDGPHDGSTLIEQECDSLLEIGGRAIVIAAGNWHDKGGHASGELEAGQSALLRWDILPDDKTANEVEIWYGGEHEFELQIISPGGKVLGPFFLNTATTILKSNIDIARVFHGDSYTNNGEHLIKIFFSTAMKSGRWGLLLRSLSKSPAIFHAWITGDPGGQSRFAPENVQLSGTLGSISCGASTLVVGAYDPLKPNDIAPDSSAGPTRTGRRKPEVSAPGVKIGAAAACYDKVIDVRSGTSLAAPHVSGLIALLMQAAGNTRLTTEQTRRAVIDCARKGPPGADWDEQYGYGRVDALSTVQSLANPATLATLKIDEGEIPMRFNINVPITPEMLKAESSHSEELVEHPPIIIDGGGSTVIKFSAEMYKRQAGTNKYVSTGLFLEKVSGLNKNTQEGHYCPVPPINVQCKTVITCQKSDMTTTPIIVRGANSVSDGSPSIEFDHTAFPQVTSLDPKVRRHFNADYKVLSMEIFTVVGDVATSIHRCGFVPGDGKCELTFHDTHLSLRS
jgi:subtilisin family serine protease